MPIKNPKMLLMIGLFVAVVIAVIVVLSVTGSNDDKPEPVPTNEKTVMSISPDVDINSVKSSIKEVEPNAIITVSDSFIGFKNRATSGPRKTITIEIPKNQTVKDLVDKNKTLDILKAVLKVDNSAELKKINYEVPENQKELHKKYLADDIDIVVSDMNYISEDITGMNIKELCETFGITPEKISNGDSIMGEMMTGEIDPSTNGNEMKMALTLSMLQAKNPNFFNDIQTKVINIMSCEQMKELSYLQTFAESDDTLGPSDSEFLIVLATCVMKGSNNCGKKTVDAIKNKDDFGKFKLMVNIMKNALTIVKKCLKEGGDGIVIPDIGDGGDGDGIVIPDIGDGGDGDGIVIPDPVKQDKFVILVCPEYTEDVVDVNMVKAKMDTMIWNGKSTVTDKGNNLYEVTVDYDGIGRVGSLNGCMNIGYSTDKPDLRQINYNTNDDGTSQRGSYNFQDFPKDSDCIKVEANRCASKVKPVVVPFPSL
uniref:Uncharacterized protein n=1 Tax=viral metagenome TaxID=1070528 RepID=A0A6C0LL51_9ZZZZ